MKSKQKYALEQTKLKFHHRIVAMCQSQVLSHSMMGTKRRVTPFLLQTLQNAKTAPGQYTRILSQIKSE
jgi:DNA-binding FadR family transcriptional regulator